MFFSCEKDKKENPITVWSTSESMLNHYREVVKDYNEGKKVCSEFMALNDGSVVEVDYISTSYSDISIKRIDSTETLMWELIIGSANQRLNIGEIIQDVDGSFIFVVAIDDAQLNMEAYILKINQNGDKIWEQTYDVNTWATIYSVNQTSDLGFILAGATSRSGMEDYLIIKTNSNGDKEWLKTYGLSHNVDEAYDIIQNQGNKYFVVGHMDYTGKYQALDLGGNIINDNDFIEGSGSQILNANDDGYIILGGYYDGVQDVYSIFLAKINQNGDIIWQKDYERTNMLDLYPHYLGTNGTNGYFVVLEEENSVGQSMTLLEFDNNGYIVLSD